MDFLRILSRSSNLARDPLRNIAHGSANDTHATSKPPPQQPESASSRKRKRGNGKVSAVKPTTVDDTTLDFFGTVSNSKLPNSHSKPSLYPRNHDENSTARDSEDEYSEPHPEDISEERCREILRKHKVKIVQLWAPSDEAVSSKEIKKKKKKKAGPSAGDEDASSSKKRRKPEVLPQPLLSFDELRSRYKTYKKLASNISAQGYRQPTEVQLGSLPLLLEPQTAGAVARPVSLLSVAPTGSGKTIAFLIPTLNAILQSRRAENSVSGPQAVILAPTKELAWQIVNEAKKLALGTGVKAVLMKKGMRVETSVEDTDDEAPAGSEASSDGEDSEVSEAETQTSPHIRRAVQPPVKAPILVATPLTLLNALKASDSAAPTPALPNITSLVLDEADILLDPLFREQTLGVISACTNPLLQMSMWSATMGANIESLAQSLLRDRASPHALVRLVVGIKDTAVAHVHHRLIYAATENGKLTALRDLLRPSSSSRQFSSKHSSSSAGSKTSTTSSTPAEEPRLRPPFLIFTQTIPRAIALHSELAYEIPAAAGGSSRLAVLHADLSARAREGVMQRFRAGEIWFLITTDVLARGIDFVGLNGVVNYDFPQSAAVYVHRVGRAGRMGRAGVAVTLYAKEDVPFVKAVVNVIQTSQNAPTTSATNSNGNTYGSVGTTNVNGDADNSKTNTKTNRVGVGNTNGTSRYANKLPDHLLNLPAPSKRAKKELKRYGIASRRTGATVKTSAGGEDKARKLTKTRISTKSGYDRRQDNRRRELMAGNSARSSIKSGRNNRSENGDGGVYPKIGDGDGDEEFLGFE